MSNKLRAFVIRDALADEGTILIFARSPNRAKYLALGRDWFEYSEYKDLRARREKRADKFVYKFGEGELPYSPESDRILRNLGWYPGYREAETCIECGLYEWEAVPESRLHYVPEGVELICNACDEREAVNNNEENIHKGKSHEPTS